MYEVNLGLLLTNTVCHLFPCTASRVWEQQPWREGRSHHLGCAQWKHSPAPRSVFFLSYMLREFSLWVVVVSSVLFLGTDVPEHS